MHSKVHRAISKQIAMLLDPNRNWEVFIAASDAPDWKPSGQGHHRRREPTQDIDQIIELLRSARRAWLHNCSSEFEEKMGLAFHYIQDRFIRSSDKSLHARFEAAISRALPGLIPWGKVKPLDGEEEVMSYLRNEVKFIEEPDEILDQAFIVCLSVATAICKNENGFEKGVTANQFAQTLHDQIEIVSRESRKLLDTLRAKLVQIVSSTRVGYDNAHEDYLHKVSNRTSFIRKVISFVLLEDWCYRRKFSKIRREFAKRIEELSLEQREEFGSIKCNQNAIIQTIQEIEELLATSYEKEYKVRRLSTMWYGIQNIANFKSPNEMRLLVVKAREELQSTCKEWEYFIFDIEKDRQSVFEVLIPLTADTF